MASRSPSLLVQVSLADLPWERVQKKLEIYFQSQKKSRGDECEVRPVDRERGIYSVHFRSEEVKNRVKVHKDHSIEIGNRILKIQILPDSGMTTMDSAERSLTNSLISPSANSLPASSALQLQSDLERRFDGKYAGDRDSIAGKIFLSVSATLNTDLFTEQERRDVIDLCPTLRVDGISSHHGIEKVSGGYGDIEKLHHLFEKRLGSSHRHANEFLHPKIQNGLEEMDMGSQKDRNKSDSEDVCCELEVPSGIFEYFSQAFKETVEELEQKFNVKITSNEHENGLTSVRFNSAGSLNLIEKAQQDFVTAFQKVAADVKQERIPFTNHQQFDKAQEMLSTKYKSILVKTDQNELILRGPAKEISAAKREIEASYLDKVPESPPPMKSDIEVDADIFELMEPKLSKEIEAIKQKYDTTMERKKCLRSQKAIIRFMPKKHGKSDQSSKAYGHFHYVYQNTLKQTTRKEIPLKLSENQQRKLDAFLSQLQAENTRVFLEKKGNKLFIEGPLEHVCYAEKHIMKFLNTDMNPDHGNLPIPGSSPRATSGAYFEPNSAHNMRPVSREQAGSQAVGAKQEEECSICMDLIDQKEVLPKCKHAFCKTCITEAMKYKPTCPVCNMFYGKMEGNQPPGTMQVNKLRTSLPGYEQYGTIEIAYHILDGIQTTSHPNPGRGFRGAYRTAYLPNNKEGNEILCLLQRAFEQKLIFTVGQSRTTGLCDVVTWNDIHHKTGKHGGPESFGYPDPSYLKRVREELKAKGIV
ncbi:E3 ubiquitin-protein ligase DTX3L [Elgaria multicarinata webbii]|uniref:E3 ubiquitin-protein ligase DTX3L n=1 Tax=Elgaria multicarinata webbii TaxID=159646 RepID=UPI002FCD6752